MEFLNYAQTTSSSWNNFFVMMFTEEQVEAERFLALPYQKKICFVPFESDEKELVRVDFRNHGCMADVPFWRIVNGMATGLYPYYDVVDLLNEGKLTKIVKN